jgi:hypothetical protein
MKVEALDGGTHAVDGSSVHKLGTSSSSTNAGEKKGLVALTEFRVRPNNICGECFD